MGRYNLDIQRFKEKAEGQKVLKALVLLQYPVYIIHAEIIDESPDSFYGLDKAILRYMKSNKVKDSNELSKLLALPTSAINNRVKSLQETHLLNRDNEVTKIGSRYIEGKYEGLIQTISRDFIIDGYGLMPLNEEFYSKKYRENFNLENEYRFYLKDDGEVGFNYNYSPDITHTPIEKDKIISELLTLERDQRTNFKIPIGLKEITSFSYSLGTLPIMVGLFKNANGLSRQLVNCFESDGNPNLLQFINKHFKARFDNLQLRLNEFEVRDQKLYSFDSNWKEIDNVNSEENNLYFFSKEDLRSYFMNLYDIKELELSDIIYQPNTIGLLVNKEVFDATSRKKKILKNIGRGEDYKIEHSISSGVWTIFFEFKSGDEFINQAVDLLEFLDLSQEKDFPKSKVLEKVQTFPEYRKILIGLEEFALLEEIDIKDYMTLY